MHSNEFASASFCFHSDFTLLLKISFVEFDEVNGGCVLTVIKKLHLVEVSSKVNNVNGNKSIHHRKVQTI